MRQIDEKYDESGLPGIRSKGERAFFFKKGDIVKIMISLVPSGLILKLDSRKLHFHESG
jgi:hypothetical protein